MLAVQFGLERFHQYTYGQHVTIQTDHKPLLGIVKRPLAELSPRLQRMRLRCLRYQYTLEYHPAKEMVLADTLSRTPNSSLYDDYDDLTDHQISSVMEQTIPTPLCRTRCQEATKNDPTMQALLMYMRTGWPATKKALPGPVKPYWTVSQDLAEKDGITFKGNQAVVPLILRNKVLATIHDGHLGIVKCIERAKTTVYWPGYINDIKEMVSRCSKCQQHRNKNPKPSVHPHEVPVFPFQKVGTDLFEHKGAHYLLTVDYYSRWITIDHLESTRSSAVINALDAQFANFGIPEILFSDNGPQFANQEFTEFARRLGFTQVTSSPGHPASNGLAERNVQTAKQTMTKMFEDGRSLPDVLRALRTTPIGGGLPSPATLLQGRQIRTQLAIDTETFTPQLRDPETIRGLLQQYQSQQLYYASSERVTPPPLLPGENVRVRQGKTWVPAQVVDYAPEPLSYFVKMPSGRTLRRTREHINKTTETWGDRQLDSPQLSIPTPIPKSATVEDQNPQPMPPDTCQGKDRDVTQTQNRRTPSATVNTETATVPTPPPVMTRSGRTSRPPSHLANDYLL